MTSEKVCPDCGSSDLVSIVYGLPGTELFEAAEEGRVAIGGCVIGEDDPTETCRTCDASIWPGGVFCFEGGSEIQTPLMQVQRERIAIYLDAKVTETGDLILSGQDIGASVEQIFGSSDYEYRLEVEAGDKGSVLAALLLDRLPTVAALVEQLDEWRIPVRLLGPVDPSTYEVATVSGGELAISLAGEEAPVATVPCVDRLLLLLLKDAYADGTYTSDSQFREWLDGHNIPSKFSSYG